MSKGIDLLVIHELKCTENDARKDKVNEFYDQVQIKSTCKEDKLLIFGV